MKKNTEKIEAEKEKNEKENKEKIEEENKEKNEGENKVNEWRRK